ncbi:hypothetical protein CDD82_3457 [Ophiocordyceps australis]|uniref:Gti1/Pac2 family protein n=1 Tax=Ophiocordyceps australis TaxID=1399860 RepID=A0A2C5Z6W9_9HYPO|nr:hypothetical protein CDD82_3457 [Ophiocordyceps australis]
MSSQSSPLKPTWRGHIASTLDALLLFEASLKGIITHVPRRPHDRERQDLIKSGSVFIYEEHSSGIKRWTDGVSWSPSRILGNFLIYRELEKPFPPGEKKRALKKKKCGNPAGVSKNQHVAHHQPSTLTAFTSAGVEIGKDTERALIGSLVDSYPFKQGGLIKKTISITYRGVPHHLVSYYTLQDVVTGAYMTPSRDDRFKNLVPRNDLMTQQNFRSPVDEFRHTPPDSGNPYGPVTDYGPSGSILQRAWANVHPNGQAASYQNAAQNYPIAQNMHNSYVAPSLGSYGNSSMASYVGPSMGSSVGQSMGSSVGQSMGSSVGQSMGSSMSSINPSMGLPMTSSMGPSMGSSMTVALPQSMSQAMPPLLSSPSTNNHQLPPPPPQHTSFAPHSQGNYTLDTGRASRFGSGPAMTNDFPSIGGRAPRFSSGASMGNDFSTAGGQDGAPPQYALDENSSQWSFDAMDNSQAQDQHTQQSYYGRN